MAAALVVLLARGGIPWWDWSRDGSAALIWSLSIKLGVSALIVLLGWWVGRARPRRNCRRRLLRKQRRRARPRPGAPSGHAAR